MSLAHAEIVGLFIERNEGTLKTLPPSLYPRDEKACQCVRDYPWLNGKNYERDAKFLRKISCAAWTPEGLKDIFK